MANKDQGRNPITGVYLSVGETKTRQAMLGSMARYARVAVEQHGLSPVEQQLVGMRETVTGDAPAVQRYIIPMIDLARKWSGTAGEFAKVIALIQDANNVAQKQDITLKPEERKRINNFALYLISFIRKQTTMFSRLTGSMKNVAKAGAEKLSDKLSDSPSAIFKLASKALAIGSRDKKQTADRDILKTKSDILKKFLPAGSAAGGFNSMNWDDDEDDDEPVHRPSKVKHVSTGGKKAKEQEAIAKDATLDEILLVDRAILNQLTIQSQILRTGGELSKQEQEAKERAADEGSKVVRVPNAPTGVETGKKAKTESSLFSKLANIVGSFDIAKMLGPVLLPAVSALGTGLLAAAAAAAGWKLGKYLDDLSGGKLSGGVEHLASALMNTGERNTKEQVTEQGTDEMNRARMRTGKQPKNVAEARQWNEEWAKAHRSVGNVGRPVAPQTQKSVNLTPLDSTYLPETGTRIPNVAPSMVPAAPKTPPATNGSSPIRVSASSMHVSEDGIKSIKAREGFRKTPYWDVTGWAIGYGDHDYHGQPLGTDPNVKPAVTMTDAEADEALRKRIAAHYEPLIRKNLNGKPVTQGEFDSLISVSYNSEPAGARLARRLAAGEKLSVKDFTASGTIHGQKVPELQKRRSDEFTQFISQPSPGRNAAPVVSLTAATQDRGQSGNGTNISAPRTVVTQSTGAPTIVPVPMTTENPDAVQRSIRGLNAI